MSKTKRKEVFYNKLIGKIENEYYFLDRTFDEGKNYKGAVGTIVEVLTEEEYNERVEDYFEPENMKEFWQQAVERDKTELSLEGWISLVIENDGEEIAIEEGTEEQTDTLKELLGEDKVFKTDIRSGGRCFYKDMKWDKLYNKELWEVIKTIEK